MSKAYLVVDMSNDFVHDDGSLTAGKPAQKIVPQIIQTLDMYYSENALIVFCMDAHQPDDDHFQLWAPHNVIGTWGAELFGEIKTWYDHHKQSNHVLFMPKQEYDAFYKSELESILKEHRITEVRIAGVCTDICVVHTVYGAYKSGYPTTVSARECATFTANHQTFLDHMNLVYKTKIE